MQRHSWEKVYPSGISWSEPPTVAPLESLLEASAMQWPNGVAMDFYDATVTFGELYKCAARAAKGLQSLGVGPGVNVGLHLLNTPHYPICFFGVLMAGGRIVSFSPYAASRDVERQIVDADVDIMVSLAVSPLYPLAVAAASRGLLRTVVVCHLEDFLAAGSAAEIADVCHDVMPSADRQVAFCELIANDGAYRRYPHGPLDHDIALLQYTGGTTGEPKGAMLTHANVSAAEQLARRWIGRYLSHRKTMLLALPLFHVFGLLVMLLALAAGTRIVLHIRFDAGRTLADVSRKKVTIFFGVPVMYSALIEHPGMAGADLLSLELCGSGGAPLPAAVAARFKECTGTAILQGYSLTETTDLGTWQVVGAEPREGTVGVPFPQTTVEILDLETGTRVLPAGQRGEVCFSGPQVMAGYWKRSEATAEVLRDGRLYSGDIGFLDEDGYLTLVDRKKDMLLCGGYNVFPRKVEAAIREHPAVADVTVIGIPDPDFGHLLKAFIVIARGAAPVSYREIRAFLTDKVAAYEMPVEIEIRADLPRTGAGKVSKTELVEEELARRGVLAH